MSQKQDLPDLYVWESQTYKTIKELGSDRTTTGNLAMTSSSSSTTYNSITGQLGIMQQLETILNPYKINSEDWNSVDENITNINATIAKLRCGGLPY
jgi:hypothetical protein